MRKIIRKLVTIELSWKFLQFFYNLFYRFKFEKDLIQIEIKNNEMAQREAVLKKKFSSLTVAVGLFKGMVYPDFTAYGSAIFPKLLGTYESELYFEVEQLLKNNYKYIIDIGCAEGFYAVGTARLSPSSIILAYDINEKAISFCKQMAQLNNVSNIKFGDFCSQDTLRELDFGNKSLIICDCEGYEKELFDKNISSSLKKCDILIELHDLYDETISPSILKEFSSTHDAKFIYSENTFEKIRKINALKDVSDNDVKAFFNERTGIMRWVILTSKV